MGKSLGTVRESPIFLTIRDSLGNQPRSQGFLGDIEEDNKENIPKEKIMPLHMIAG